jgi:hypothetical protein
MHLLMLINVFAHASYVGYDGWGFIFYIGELSLGHLPTREQTMEFFTPPLPFAAPALAMRLFGLNILQAAKIAQVMQLFVSMGTVCCLVRLCNRIGMDRVGTFFTLLLLAVRPVYSRTFAMVRGEPWVLFFIILMLDRITLIWFEDRMHWKEAIWLGVFLGLGLLGRHWMIFTVPMLFVVGGVAYWKLPSRRKETVRIVFLSLLVGFIISSWFFFHLKLTTGSFSGFPRTPSKSFALNNVPDGFFTDLAFWDLMNRPRRPHLNSKVWPVMYAETFGDYACYFAVYFQEKQTGEYIAFFRVVRAKKNLSELPAKMERYTTNVNTIMPYMALAMRVSLFPCLLLIAGFCFSGWRMFFVRQLPDADRRVRLLLLIYSVLFLTTIMGYGWFLVMFSYDYGDTIKPTYILHVFPFIVLCGGWMMQTLTKCWPRLGVALLVWLCATWVMLLPMMISRHGVLQSWFDFLEVG